MTQFTTDNIDQVRAVPLDFPGRYAITFRSANSGMYHQLYVNGRLADWTEAIAQRRFILDAGSSPQQVVIAAVDAARCAVDMSSRLPSSLRQPSWLLRASYPLNCRHRPGDRLEVLGDHATGQMDPVPLLVRELQPRWTPQWAWGQSAFGVGGFGYDGIGAPGLGKGAFGAGLFGIGADVVIVELPLAQEGTHQIVLRAIAPDGRHNDEAAAELVVHPPPRAPQSIEITSYQPLTDSLTLQIE